jgi:hypothetical protein
MHKLRIISLKHQEQTEELDLPCGDDTFFDEYRRKLSETFNVCLRAWMFILGKMFDTFLAFEFDRGNFIIEKASLLSFFDGSNSERTGLVRGENTFAIMISQMKLAPTCSPSLLREKCKLVTFFARDTVLLAKVFCGDGHWDLLWISVNKSIGQGVFQFL